ncbi:hypothetical protein Fmac_029630 [Flemingia macrophylla]|uniref:VQ domain-containing protein n=1 Tax=Flemingia macrophylla TaxID=520843 RepID=A0ABD1LB19_9FABA
MNTISTSNSVMPSNSNNNSNSNSVHQRTPTKRITKAKKKNNSGASQPVKVVYISNPMKINTSAAEFRALVQELTGQDAESPPDPTRFQPHLLPPAPDPIPHQHQHQHQPPQQPPSSCIDPFEDDDDVFTPQMFDNISSLLPTSLFYESPHLNHWSCGTAAPAVLLFTRGGDK